MAEDGAMPQAGVETLDPQVADANLAKELTERMLANFPFDVCGEKTILTGHYTVEVICQALGLFRTKHPSVRPYLVPGTTYGTLVVEFDKK